MTRSVSQDLQGALVKQHFIRRDGDVSPFTKWERQRMALKHCVKCPAKVCKRSGRFCNKHRLQHNARSKRNQAKNKKLASYRTKISSHRARIRVMVALGGLFCKWCGENDYRVLSIDHIDGHGAPIKKRKRHRSGLTSADIYAIERGEVDHKQLRVLCANCQARNEHRRGKRVVYPEIRNTVADAGGIIGGDYDKPAV